MTTTTEGQQLKTVEGYDKDGGDASAAEPGGLEKRRMITLAELEKHNKEDDCWIAQHGLVLKLPDDFLNEHPGGPEVITSISGKDVTSDFEDIGHSDSAREWADRYIIGWLEGTEDENKETKMHPRTSELRAAGGGGSALGGLVPVVLAVVVAVAAYFYLQN